MTIARRDFVNAFATTGIAALGGTVAPKYSVAAGASPHLGTLNDAVFDFWHTKVRSPYEDFVNNVQRQGVVIPNPADSVFLFLSETKGLGPAALLDTDDIQDFPEKGDVSVSVHVDRFRP